MKPKKPKSLFDVPIHEIDAWPPGELMVYRSAWFCGIGIVVSNDGVSQIIVMWDSSCKKRLSHYDVVSLNPNVISRLRPLDT